MTVAEAAPEEFAVGHAGGRIRIDRRWRVLDVGSGHNPHPRADVLLERYVGADVGRGGETIDTSDPRLVVGDALDMPFEDGEFDYVIASHIAEHVDDPQQLCRELSRVARAGYIETPGWFGDMLMREDYHRWRVRARGRKSLQFDEVSPHRPFGLVGEAVYFIVYFGEERPGHRIPHVENRILAGILRFMKRVAGRVIRSPAIRPLFFTFVEWSGEVQCVVRRLPDDDASTPR